MDKEQSIRQVVNILQQLPADKVQQVAHFAEFLLLKYGESPGEDNTGDPGKPNPLKDRDEWYNEDDFKERY